MLRSSWLPLPSAWPPAARGRWAVDDPVLLCVSGRGDKDVAQVAAREAGAR